MVGETLAIKLRREADTVPSNLSHSADLSAPTSVHVYHSSNLLGKSSSALKAVVLVTGSEEHRASISHSCCMFLWKGPFDL